MSAIKLTVNGRQHASDVPDNRGQAIDRAGRIRLYRLPVNQSARLRAMKGGRHAC